MAKLVNLNEKRLAESKAKKKTPARFSPLGMYGDRRVFVKCLEEGYLHCAHGGGDWVNGECIIAIFVFYKPGTDIVRTLETRKFDDGFRKLHGKSETHDYTAKEFEALCVEYKLYIGEKRSLVALLESWSD